MKALARIIGIWILGVGLSSIFLLSPIVHAYGGDAYGRCKYGTSPSACNTNTTTVTPTGLKVSVNLVDGQVIPLRGYQVVITPLNGQGSSFASADIYIDGKKVATVTPGSNGTAIWFWDVNTYPSGKITVVVRDTTGKQTPLPFDVVIQERPTAGAPVPVDTTPVVVAPSTPTTSNDQGDKTQQSPRNAFATFFSNVGTSLQGAVQDIIKALPQAVVRAFPYLLFLLILLEILILVYITRREIVELKELRRLAAREKQLASMKQKFTGLVSHYLRTPLTVMTGGLEGLSDEDASKVTAQEMSPIMAGIHDTIENIVGRTSAEALGSSSVISKTRTISMAKLFAVWLPVVVIGVLAIVFIYLAHNIDRYEVSTIDSMTLAVFYTVLMVGLYVVVRQWGLRKSELDAARDVLAYETRLHEAQDAVINEATSTLLQQQKQLEPLVASLNGSVYSTYIKDGFDRLSRTINRFAIATVIKGSKPSGEPQGALMSQLLDDAQKGLMDKEDEKGVSVSLAGDKQVAVRNPHLLSIVLKGLLDNSINYSRAGQKIEVAVDQSDKNYAITVTDHGSGIAPDQLATVFEPFNRVEDIEDFDHEGLGFSLYLNKLIMTYLGGNISASSRPQDATTFTLYLPAAN